MISLEKGMILTPLQKLPSNVGNIIVATSFEWLSKVQKTAQSGHTVKKSNVDLQPTTWVIKIRLNHDILIAHVVQCFYY